jgi:hypothetical protein
MVFVITVIAAVAMLSLAMEKNKTFYSELTLMNNAKLAVIKYQNLEILVREITSIANGEIADFTLFPLPMNVSNKAFLQSQILSQSEAFRNLLLEVDSPVYKSTYSS